MNNNRFTKAQKDDQTDYNKTSEEIGMTPATTFMRSIDPWVIIKDWAQYLRVKNFIKTSGDYRSTIEIPYKETALLSKGVNLKYEIFDSVLSFKTKKKLNLRPRSAQRCYKLATREDVICDANL